ncbi:MAG: ABC transporter ATP-binding protein [Gemmataceae bacterium]
MLLQARDLTRVYNTLRGPILALDGLSLEVHAGEYLAVCGRSGSGKSTLLGLLGGLSRPTRGAVHVDGRDLWSMLPRELSLFRANRCGFLFQSAGLLPSLRAIDNIALPALLAGKTQKESYDRARDLLDQVHLLDRFDAYPSTLSGGQQRRVALARALVNRPLLLLADEPTNNLDEASEREVLELLQELPTKMGTTLVVVTHQAQLARQASRVIYLSANSARGVTCRVLEAGIGWVCAHMLGTYTQF